jgi:nitrogen-specific signal transduction histidine kinase
MSLNISSHGVFCPVPRGVGVNDRVMVIVGVPYAEGDAGVVECEGVVVRTEPAPTTLGAAIQYAAINFRNVPRESAFLIRDYLTGSQLQCGEKSKPDLRRQPTLAPPCCDFPCVDRDAITQQHRQRTERMAFLRDVASRLAPAIKDRLAGVSGALQILSEEAPPSSVPDGIYRDIFEEIAALDKLADTLARYHRPSLPLFSSTRLEPVVERALETVNGMLESRGIEARLQPGADLPIIQADEVLLTQAFAALFVNAAESMGQGVLTVQFCAGTPRCDCPECECTKGESCVDEHVSVLIGDGGTGAAPFSFDRALTLFPAVGGAHCGNGLPFAHQVIDQHEGFLYVASSPTSGSIFVVELPRYQSEVC